jgi:hypothetical protein
MRSRLLPTGTSLTALFLLLASLTGCSTSSTAPLVTTPIATEIGNNWQIQSGTAITATSTGGGFLTGPMQIQGTQVTATFQSNVTCVDVPQPVAFTGTYNSTTGALSLQPTGTPFVDVGLTIPTDPTSLATGTMGGAGNICALAFTGPAVGIEIPTFTGTYTGSVAAASPSTSTGTATLTVSQSATANDAQFPLTGTLQFTSGTCTTSIPVNGAISGASFTLASASTATSATITGGDTQAGASLPATAITFPNGPCNTGASSAATYTGNLTLQ